MYLLKEFEEDKLKIWDSNIFGKSLHDLVTEGLHAKLYHMPVDARREAAGNPRAGHQRRLQRPDLHYSLSVVPCWPVWMVGWNPMAFPQERGRCFAPFLSLGLLLQNVPIRLDNYLQSSVSRKLLSFPL